MKDKEKKIKDFFIDYNKRMICLYCQEEIKWGNDEVPTCWKSSCNLKMWIKKINKGDLRLINRHK
jgi:hypothetical protein